MMIKLFCFDFSPSVFHPMILNKSHKKDHVSDQKDSSVGLFTIFDPLGTFTSWNLDRF